MAATSPAPATGLRMGLKRTAFGSLATLARMDPSGQGTWAFNRAVIRRLSGDPVQLQSLAWHAEKREDLALAALAWTEIAVTRGYSQKTLSPAKIFRKIATLETRMRRILGYYAEGRVLRADGMPDLPLETARFADMRPPGDKVLRHYARTLRVLTEATDALTPMAQSRMQKAYIGLAAHRTRAGRPHIALAALHGLMARWPAYQIAYPLFYKAVLHRLLDAATSGQDTAAPMARIADWWRLYAARCDQLTPTTRTKIWGLSLRIANQLQATGAVDLSEAIITEAMAHRTDGTENALPILARVAESRGDWTTAAAQWQLYAAILNPVSTKSGTIKADNVAERTKRTNAGRTALRRVRAKLALEAHAAGRMRAFRELACRIVESLPDQRVLKYDPDLLEVARLYVQDGLRDLGAFTPPARSPDAPLRRVVLALDILKISEVHTHSRVIFTMCRNLLAHDPDLEMHVVITNERFAVTTPIVSASFDPSRDTEAEIRAREALGDLYGTRFHLHAHMGQGLESLVQVSRKILDLDPDLVLYGGGHRGLFSNETRVVRHALFDLLPAAFFYIQANNQVDPKFDMVITRGPHAVEGDPGTAVVREQPYPTIVDAALSAAQQEINPDKAASKVLVSAITGVRMDVRLSQMTKPEMAGFFSILDRVEGAVWHFIGCQDIRAVCKANPEIARRRKAGQIKLHTVMPFDDFTALVGNCALFLHLPGFTGGSGGAAVARRGAIPILTFNHSDVSGRQPPETIFEDDNVAGFADKAVTLLQDPAAWTATAQAQIDHTTWIRDTSVQGFHACLSEAARIGRGRIEQVPPEAPPAPEQMPAQS